jgi:aquaporin Z
MAFPLVMAAIAECVGTAFFLSCLLMYIDNPFYIGLGLIGGLLAVGKISGGHLNSLVSYMLYFRGDIDTTTFLVYIVAQLIGATLALLWWKNTVGLKKVGKS